MEIENVMTIPAAPEAVWVMLLNPELMASCVPGVHSVEVISPVEYAAVIQVRLAFINAKFRVRTTIEEQDAPRYMKCTGTGEDKSVASSLRQQTELFLEPEGEGTRLRMKVRVDLLGRLGTFGLSAVRTKADRMWEEFGQNLASRLRPASAAAVPEAVTAASEMLRAETLQAAPETPSERQRVPTGDEGAVPSVATRIGGLWQRLFGSVPTAGARAGVYIRVSVEEKGRLVTVEWPIHDADGCRAWLREVLGPDTERTIGEVPGPCSAA